MGPALRAAGRSYFCLALSKVFLSPCCKGSAPQLVAVALAGSEGMCSLAEICPCSGLWKNSPCRHHTPLPVYHCRAGGTDPKTQRAASRASPAWLGEAREQAGKRRARVLWALALPVPATTGPVVSGGYIRDHESCVRPGDRGFSSVLLTCIFLNAKSCPQMEIVSSRCCSRTRSLLFPARCLNFSGGWRLIDVAISFYSTSVKSKLPSQCCCRGDSSRKAAEPPSRGGRTVGGGQGWQAASDQRVRLVFKTQRRFSNCRVAFFFAPVCPCASAAPGERAAKCLGNRSCSALRCCLVSREKRFSAAP